MRPSTEEVSLVVEMGEETERRPQIERVPCVTELSDAVQDLLRISSFVLAPYLFQVQAKPGIIYESIHVLPVV